MIWCHVYVSPNGFVFDYDNYGEGQTVNPQSLMATVNAMRQNGETELDLLSTDGDIYSAYMEKWYSNANPT